MREGRSAGGRSELSDHHHHRQRPRHRPALGHEYRGRFRRGRRQCRQQHGRRRDDDLAGTGPGGLEESHGHDSPRDKEEPSRASTTNLLVSNVGGVPTTDVVTLIDSVPAGLIPVAAAGPGWSCSIALQSVTCTRADTLAAGASYPAVTLTVDVEPGAPASVVNTATIAGGGDINSANNTVTDPTPINRGQNLTISKSHNAGFTQGQRGATYTIVVTNVGEAPTLGTVTVIDTVPDGLFPTAASGAGWTCSVSGQTSNCSRGDALGAGASYEPVTITVDVAADAPASIINRAVRRRRRRCAVIRQHRGGPHGCRDGPGPDAGEEPCQPRRTRPIRDVRCSRRPTAAGRRRRGSSTWSTTCRSG